MVSVANLLKIALGGLLMLSVAGCLSNQPLQKALKEGNDAAVREIINGGVDVNSRLANGFTPLGVAAFLNKPDLVKFLLDKNADVNVVNNHGSTPLYYAVQMANSLEITEMLLKHGANPNIYKINPPLLAACVDNDFEMVKLLIAYGADVNCKNPFNTTPLLNPIDDFRIAEYLVAKGANVNAKEKKRVGGRTPLTLTVVRMIDDKLKIKIMDLLISHGADVNAIENGSGCTALDLAIKNKVSKEVITSLRKHGAKSVTELGR